MSALLIENWKDHSWFRVKLSFWFKKSGEGLRPILLYKYKVQIASKYFPVENIASQVQSTFSGDNGQMLLKQWSVPTAQIKDKKSSNRCWWETGIGIGLKVHSQHIFVYSRTLYFGTDWTSLRPCRDQTDDFINKE